MKHLNQSGGFLGGVFGGQNSNSGSGVVTPGSLGTIGGGMTSIPRPNRPIRPRPIPRPTPGGMVPYHTHTIETSGPIYGGGRPGRPVRPVRPGRPFFGRPRPIPRPTPPNLGTIGGIVGQYANASGNCPLWMCGEY